jgi:hypothetical protein
MSQKLALRWEEGERYVNRILRKMNFFKPLCSDVRR